MAEFDIKNYDGQLYLREELKKILHSNPLKAIANAESVLVFPKDTPLDAVEESVRIILQDIQLRRKKLARENNQILPTE